MWFIGLWCVVHYSLSYCEAYNFIQIVNVLIVLYFCGKSSIIEVKNLMLTLVIGCMALFISY